MKFLILAFCVAAVSCSDKDATILRSDFQQSSDGFQYAYETDNGIAGQASGSVKPIGKDEVALEVQGSNQYKSPEGDIIQLTYIANEAGYQPQGAHLPTPPPPQPIPDYILRSLEYIATHPYVEKKV